MDGCMAWRRRKMTGVRGKEERRTKTTVHVFDFKLRTAKKPKPLAQLLGKSDITVTAE